MPVNENGIKQNVESKSLKLNMVFNGIKGVMSVLFPLITFPYVSRVLGVDQVGKYNFSNSIINYFLLLAGLGVAAYARREGSAIRDNRNELSQFAGEMFSINIITTVLSYIVLFICVHLSGKLQQYSAIIYVLSLTIVLQTIGIEWLYSIYEDYFYITARSIAFQLLSLLLLFLFVKDQNDLLVYTWIVVLSNAGSNILNFVHSRKYCRLFLTWKINWKKHLKPILIFFSTTLSVTIYVSSDMTILGFLCDDYNVGLYAVSVKVYTIVKSILASVIVVSIPRLCAYEGQGRRDSFLDTASDVYKTIITVTLPALIGILIYSTEIVTLVGGEEYHDANYSLALLAVALICYMFSYFWGQCILVPLKKEKISLYSAIVSAVINIVLNFVLIPFYKQNAAAFTTIIGEGTAMLIGMYYSNKLIRLQSSIKIIIKTVVGCVPIIIIGVVSKMLFDSVVLRLGVGIPLSVISFITIEIAMKNETIYSIVQKLKEKVRL